MKFSNLLIFASLSHLITAAPCNWKQVRYLPANWNSWHPATDQMQGIDSYGDPNDNRLPWSIPFNADPYDQIMFTTNDGMNYIITERSTLIIGNWINGLSPNIRSSNNPTTPG